jgi:hypothetical protein
MYVYVLITGRTQEVIGVYADEMSCQIDMQKWSASTGDHECSFERWLLATKPNLIRGEIKLVRSRL